MLNSWPHAIPFRNQLWTFGFFFCICNWFFRLDKLLLLLNFYWLMTCIELIFWVFDTLGFFLQSSSIILDSYGVKIGWNHLLFSFLFLFLLLFFSFSFSYFYFFLFFLFSFLSFFLADWIDGVKALVEKFLLAIGSQFYFHIFFTFDCWFNFIELYFPPLVQNCLYIFYIHSSYWYDFHNVRTWIACFLTQTTQTVPQIWPIHSFCGPELFEHIISVSVEVFYVIIISLRELIFAIIKTSHIQLTYLIFREDAVMDWFGQFL